MKIDWQRLGIKELAACVAGKLRDRGIDALLVGGGCVSIYTRNKYQSFDLDFVSHAPLKDIAAVLGDLGFQRKSGRHFSRRECPYFIEFVAPPAALGNETIKDEQELRTRFGTLILLTATDCVKDRLAAYYHWNDPQALEQAAMVAENQRINLREIKRWSEQEGFREKYQDFLKKRRGTAKRTLQSKL